MPYSVSKAKRATQELPVESWLLLLSYYGVILSGALALAVVSGATGHLFIALFACVAHAMVVGAGGRALLGERMSSLLAVAAVVLFALQAKDHKVGVGYAGARFLIAVQLIRLFGVHRARDMGMSQIAALFVILVGARWAMQISYAFNLLLAAFCLMANAMLLTLAPSAARQGGHVRRLRWANGRDLVSGLWFPGIVVMACAVLLFVLFPRTTIGQDALLGGGGHMVGFSEDVSLREVGELRESYAVALRVQFFDGEQIGSVPTVPPRLLMRGATMARYHRGRWLNAQHRIVRAMRIAPEMSPGFEGGASFLPTDPDLERRTIRQRVTLGERPSRTYFGLYRPVSLNGDAGVVHSLTHEIAPRRQRTGFQDSYTVESVVYTFSADRLRQAGTPSREGHEPWGFFWDVPTDLRPVLERQARLIEQRSNPRTDYDRVVATARYLMDPANFGYTLSLPVYGAGDPLEAFLTETRVGSCEQFSTALALILRTWDIPTRLAVGFKGGEPDGADGSYVFLDRDAHAWVEVFFNDLGWVEFDPTPGSALDAQAAVTGLDSPGLIERTHRTLREAIRRMRSAWRGDVIHFSKTHQERLMRWLSSATHILVVQLSFFFGALVPGGKFSGTGAVVLAAVVVISVLFVAYLFAHTVTRLAPSRQRTVIPEGAVFYADLLKALRRNGLERPPQATPREFAESLGARVAGAGEAAARLMGAVRLVTDIYCRTRFGGYPLTPDQEQQVRGALAAVGDALPSLRAVCRKGAEV